MFESDDTAETTGFRSAATRPLLVRPLNKASSLPLCLSLLCCERSRTSSTVIRRLVGLRSRVYTPPYI